MAKMKKAMYLAMMISSEFSCIFHFWDIFNLILVIALLALIYSKRSGELMLRYLKSLLSLGASLAGWRTGRRKSKRTLARLQELCLLASIRILIFICWTLTKLTMLMMIAFNFLEAVDKPGVEEESLNPFLAIQLICDTPQAVGVKVERPQRWSEDEQLYDPSTR